MTHRVLIQPSAEEDIDSIVRWIAENSPRNAGEWYQRIKNAISSLSQNPKRCPIAPENEFFEEEIRHLLYGRRQYIYRILFTVHKDVVHVLHVRHGAMRLLNPSDGV